VTESGRIPRMVIGVDPWWKEVGMAVRIVYLGTLVALLSSCQSSSPVEVDAGSTDSDVDTDSDTDTDTDTLNHIGRHFRDVMGTGPDDIYAVGTCGLLLHFDGELWAEIDLGVEDNLNAIWAIAPNDIWIGGKRHYSEDDECSGGITDAYDAGMGIIYHFDGTSWQVAFEREGESQIESMWGSSENDIYAVGGRHYAPNVDESGQVGISHYNGDNWNVIDAGVIDWSCGPDVSNDYAAGIFGFGENEYYLTVCNLNLDGESTCMISHWNGESCDIETVVDVVSFEAVAVWGPYSTSLFLVEKNGQGYYFDGALWTQLDSEIDGSFTSAWHTYQLDLWGRGVNDIFAVGKAGKVIHYDGLSWKLMETGIGGDLWGVWGTEEVVYAVGDDDAALTPAERSPAIYRFDGTGWIRVY
jgi:hypothetical protein